MLLILLFLSFSCSKETTPEEPAEIINVSISANIDTIFNGQEVIFSALIDNEIKEATFYFNGQNIGSKIYPPYEVKFTPSDVEPGEHEVKCIVKSLKDNEFENSLAISLVLRLGDDFKGGKIFYLDDFGVHGLIAAKNDLEVNGRNGFFWGNTGLIGTDKTNGQENTAKMIEVSPNDTYAAFHFKNGLIINGFNDWYIPSINELKLLKENKYLVGGFSNASNWEANYWSSSELTDTNAEALHFNVLMGNSYHKQMYALKIRPIRKF